MKQAIKQKLGVSSITEAGLKLNLAHNVLNSWLSNNLTNAKVEIALLKLGLREDERLIKRIEKLKSEYKKNEIRKQAYEKYMREIKVLLEEIEAA
ncbi:hypothetical protein QD360_000122 [Campylobacter jejuni]|uniref:Uncharacterized protein n=1 Tax=Campylobacter coli TaxID=195 RepID=A0A400HTD2_CAMCO|nr:MULTISPECIES: hypothetical protein [Campylobacter]AHN82935.1 hypothetical protein 00-2425_00019 [Campylobacter phage CJIE4-3]AHN82993.1 hypothetical protein 00-6200_00019 [Campylobacter phage CJIE4-4]AAW35755.1 hypothetical protein CJE1436 [Campylobacter jejuni RM1221]AGV48133.1 hypothetical protein N755_01296 [Campylobacter jejuni subsp. jejuni 00-2544]AGV49894.1 hypothetical protein N565_01301 [Campylobacter jejuni subsp. jejuni 00-2538]